MKTIYGFQSSGNVDIRNAIGVVGKIYVPIPPEGTGKGKVHLTLQGRTLEYEAISGESDTLPTGENVVVDDILGNDVVKVVRA